MFADAQAQHKAKPDFYAPDLEEVKDMILPGDHIKVCEQDDDGGNGERYWIKVGYVDWPAIHGKVANDLVCHDRALDSTIMVEAINIYDFDPQERYMGIQADDGNIPNIGNVWVVSSESDDPTPLNPRFDLANHSPDGFAWGYAGSGPAQLALAILAHASDDETAKKYYQAFKFAKIVRLQGNWTISALEVKDWLSDERG